jgi:predicted dithiol-disulfide oxidoreductase (DUF899 family)
LTHIDKNLHPKVPQNINMAAADVRRPARQHVDQTDTIEVANPTDYLNARLSLLTKEKEATKLRDKLTAERRALPLEELTNDYTFINADTGKSRTLKDLFHGRPQLVIYHAMFDPSWENACPSCTFYLDHIPALDHLHSRDVSFAVVSRAKPETIKQYKDRMGFDRFEWYSSHDNAFNFDYHVTLPNPDGSSGSYNFYTAEELLAKGMPWFAKGENPGHSVFVKGGPVEEGGVGRGEKGKLYHSYSSYARAGENAIGTFTLLDWVPMGRQDGKLKGTNGLGFRRRGEYAEEEINGKAA